MMERRPLLPAGAAALSEAQLAERQGEVVRHDQHLDQRGVLASQHLAHRKARLVHEGERLDEQQSSPR